MVVHWFRKRKDDNTAYIKLFFNALGAVATGITLIIIISAKFLEGAWIIVLIAPLLAILLIKVKHHYDKISRVIEKPLDLQVAKLQAPIVIIPIHGWDCVAEKAMRFGLLLSDDVIALNISTEQDDNEQLQKTWAKKVEKPAKAAHYAIPHLEIIDSPYRLIYQPILDFVKKIKNENPDRLIAVIIPELIEAHWYEYLLHNIHAAILRALLFLGRDQRTIVITTPWYLHDIANHKK
jgi:hypothetical protein